MKGMNKLYYLRIEINELKKEIDNLSELSSPQLSGMPHGNKVGNPVEQYFIKKQKLVERLNKKLEKYIDELERIENIIEGIEDEIVRVIARMRFVECCKWREIAKKVRYDESVCFRKLKKYFEVKKGNE